MTRRARCTGCTGLFGVVCIGPVRLKPSTDAGSSQSAHLAHLFLDIQPTKKDNQQKEGIYPPRALVATWAKKGVHPVQFAAIPVLARVSDAQVYTSSSCAYLCIVCIEPAKTRANP